MMIELTIEELINITKRYAKKITHIDVTDWKTLYHYSAKVDVLVREDLPRSKEVLDWLNEQ